MRTIQLLHAVMVLAPGVALGQGSLDAFGRSVQHSGEAIGLSVAGSAQAVSAIAAVPLAFGAEVGKVSGEMSDELWKAANAPVGTPLLVTDEIVTVGPPPGQALQQPDRP